MQISRGNIGERYEQTGNISIQCSMKKKDGSIPHQGYNKCDKHI